MIVDDPYRDAELVDLYDLHNPISGKHNYYCALADEVEARSIIDLGCGTGSLTRSLARPGRTVIGVDPSRTMLGYARQQDGSAAVNWLHGDASVLPRGGTVDLAICTGDAIMHISPDELPSTLATLAAALRPGATLSFESRNPADRIWDRWTPEGTYMELFTPALGVLREWDEVTDVLEGRVVVDKHIEFSNCEHRVYTSILFFRTAEEFQQELELAGFTKIEWTGDWRGPRLENTPRGFVFRAQRA